jgi:putative heme-binding domain-containing protein
MPEGWAEIEQKLGASSNPEVRAQVQALSLTFGSEKALAALKKTLTDPSADLGARKTAYESLLATKDPGLPALLRQLLHDPGLQGSALRGLAAFDDPQTPSAIIEAYPTFNEAQKRDALNTLASRLSFAKPLMAAIAGGKLAKADLTAEVARQLRSLKNAEVDEALQKVWGVMRESGEDKQKEIARYRQIFRAGGSQPGDASRGRAVYVKICQQCHTLFDAGGKVGPDLTGSNRGDVDYLLQNIVDPNAVIPNDYKAWNLETKDDRSITGLLKQQDDKAVTIATANETVVIPRNEVQFLKESALSTMPEGLLQNLADQEIRDLLYYLRGPAQAPLPAGVTAEALTPNSSLDRIGRGGSAPAVAGNGKTAHLFNGKDLSNWEGDMSLWSVENGEIVGRTTTGLKHNEFLKSKETFEDFRLVLKVKLTPNKENSGVQFRSERFGAYEMRGPQADIGAGWWGKLYEENGRALLWNKPGDPFVKTNDWNTYEILAVGSKVRTSLNGHVCVDLNDEKISKRGILGLQVHAGGPVEVRFKDIRLELNPKFD